MGSYPCAIKIPMPTRMVLLNAFVFHCICGQLVESNVLLHKQTLVLVWIN